VSHSNYDSAAIQQSRNVDSQAETPIPETHGFRANRSVISEPHQPADQEERDSNKSCKRVTQERSLGNNEVNEADNTAESKQNTGDITSIHTSTP
jgi:hypothetical protein